MHGEGIVPGEDTDMEDDVESQLVAQVLQYEGENFNLKTANDSYVRQIFLAFVNGSQQLNRPGSSANSRGL